MCEIKVDHGFYLSDHCSNCMKHQTVLRMQLVFDNLDSIGSASQPFALVQRLKLMRLTWKSLRKLLAEHWQFESFIEPQPDLKDITPADCFHASLLYSLVRESVFGNTENIVDDLIDTVIEQSSNLFPPHRNTSCLTRLCSISLTVIAWLPLSIMFVCQFSNLHVLDYLYVALSEKNMYLRRKHTERSWAPYHGCIAASTSLQRIERALVHFQTAYWQERSPSENIQIACQLFRAYFRLICNGSRQ